MAPADPFILDSMGWAHYRMGNLDDSEKFLRRAFGDRSDPEIAAHLGEVLWAKGERARAPEVWQSQLKAIAGQRIAARNDAPVGALTPRRQADADAARHMRSRSRRSRRAFRLWLRARADRATGAGERRRSARRIRTHGAAVGAARHNALTANFRWTHEASETSSISPPRSAKRSPA